MREGVPLARRRRETLDEMPRRGSALEMAGLRRPRLLRVVRGVGTWAGIVSCFLDASLFGVEEKKKVWSVGGQEEPSWAEQVPPTTDSWLSRQAQQKLRRRHRAGRRKCHCRNLQLQEGAPMTSAPPPKANNRDGGSDH